MAVGKSTQKIQIGKESTSGTAVAATTIWRGNGQIKDTREVKFVPENVGIVVPTNRTYVPKLGAEIDFADTPATFEQLCYIGAAGLKNVTTGASDGVAAKVYAYTLPVAASPNTINTYTIETGDAAGAERIEYAFVSEFKISGAAGEAINMGAKWMGRQAAVNAFTAALSIPTVETALFQKAKLYVDTTGGTIGATQATNTFVSFTLTVKTGWKPIFTGDGNLYFTTHVFNDPDVTLDLTYLHDATSIANKVDWRAETAKLIRVSVAGSAISGTTYTTKTINLDCYGKWESLDKVGEKDGYSVISGKFKCALDSTASKYFDMTCVNALSSLT